MRILDVRPNHEDEDVSAAKKILKAELDHPSKNVMVIRGNGQDISMFADRAAVRSDPFPWRSAVWVKAPGKILTQQQMKWFGTDASVCAVILDFFDKPVALLKVDASHTQIEKAYLLAQGGQP